MNWQELETAYQAEARLANSSGLTVAVSVSIQTLLALRDCARSLESANEKLEQLLELSRPHVGPTYPITLAQKDSP